MPQSHVLAFGFSALCAAGAVVLTALGHSVPEQLWDLSFGALVGAGALAPASVPSDTALIPTSKV